MRATSARLTVGSLRELSTVGVVACLASAYGTVLVDAASVLSVLGGEAGGSIGAALAVVATVFIGIALFVSGIVISTGVDTVIAGRREQLRLLRLIGASASQLRAGLTRAVVTVAGIGALIGIAVATVVMAIIREVLLHRGTLPAGDYPVLPFGVVVAGVAVVAIAAIAARIGTRTTLTRAAVAQNTRSKVGVVRTLLACTVIVAGALLLALAALLGEYGSLAGFFVAFLGAVTVSVGVLLGARRIVPQLVRWAGTAFGGSAPSIVARKNAVSDPRRTTRSTIGLLVGVTLVTTIASGMSSLTRSIHSWDLPPADMAELERSFSIITAILLAMIAISAVIAAVGFVSTMSLTVIGRTREIGMLRAMGFTARQVRSMVVRESLALSGTAVIAGLVLGIVFGTVGSQSLIGSMTSGIPVSLPWGALVSIIGGTAVVVLAASLPPSRRAVAVAPVDALAVA
ncbi:ABC transporter permease [Gordonia aichiensis]